MVEAIDSSIPKLSLSMKARDLKRVDTLSQTNALCKVFLLGTDNSTIEQGSTEICPDSQNPDWTQFIEVPFIFESPQQLKFTIYNKSDDNLYEVGSAIVPMSCLAGNKAINVDLEQGDEPKGLLMVISEEVKSTGEYYTMQLGVHDLENNPSFKSLYISLMRLRPGKDYIRIYRSELLEYNENLVWNPFTIRSQHLCGNQERSPLKIEIINYSPDTKRSQIIGSGITNLIDLRNGKTVVLNNNNIKAGIADIVACQSFIKSDSTNTFLDYLRAGTQVNVIVAIDFTASNGKPTNPRSLHHINPTKLNEYELAIRSVCSILENYDSDKNFPVFGFGGIFDESGEPNHCFPLNKRPENPEVHGVDGVIELYQNTLKTCYLNAPTNLEPIIRKVKEIAERKSPVEAYWILLILTDGDISDLEETKKAIIDASVLPLSIIIVGVGSAEFQSMIELDGDQIPLTDSEGRVTKRDIVQFLSFRQFKDNPEELAKEVLYEIPAQIESFMDENGLLPRSEN